MSDNKMILLRIFKEFIKTGEIDKDDLISILDKRYLSNMQKDVDSNLLVNSDDPNAKYAIVSNTEKDIYDSYKTHTHNKKKLISSYKIDNNIKEVHDTLNSHRRSLYKVLKHKGIKVKESDSMENLCKKISDINITEGFLNDIDINIETYKDVSDYKVKLTVNNVTGNYQFSIDSSNWKSGVCIFNGIYIGSTITLYGKDLDGDIYTYEIKIPKMTVTLKRPQITINKGNITVISPDSEGFLLNGVYNPNGNIENIDGIYLICSYREEDDYLLESKSAYTKIIIKNGNLQIKEL